MSNNQLEIKLVRSLIGYNKRARVVVRTLGLRKMHQTRLVPDNAAIRGMVKKVCHLVTMRPAPEGATQ